jgi:hypothetical protein
MVVAWVFVASGMCLPSLCLTMNFYSEFTIPAFGRHVTISYCKVSVMSEMSLYSALCPVVDIRFTFGNSYTTIYLVS